MANNSNNGNLFDTYGFAEVLSQIAQNFANNGGTLANNELAEQLLEKLDGIFENTQQLSKKDIDKSFNMVATFLRSVYGNSAEMTNALKAAREEVKAISVKQNISDKLMVNLLTGVISLLHNISMNANAKGEKGPLNVGNPKDKLTATMLNQIFQSQFQRITDSAVDKILNFFRDQSGKEKTKKRQFIEDLVEGLGRSKWVGGAFTDIIRLVSFFAASWLKNLGPIGKALAVGVIAAAPILANALMNVLTKGLLSLGGKILSGISSGIVSMLTKILGQRAAGGFLGNLMGGLGSRAAVGSAGRVVAGTVARSLATGAAIGGTEAIVGIGSASVGAAGAAAGGGVLAGLSAMLSPLLAVIGPILAIAAGIAALVGIGFLVVKNWDKITKWCEEIKNKLSDLGKSWIDAFNDFMDEHPVLNKVAQTVASTVPGGGIAYNAVRGQGDLKAAYKSDKLEIGKDGSILNLDTMSQQEAAQQLEKYRDEHEKEFDNIYEIAGSKHAHMVDFQNDAVMKDKSGQLGAVLYKGASNDLDNLREQLKKQGMSEDKVSALLFTSGMSTAGSPHKKGGWKSHSNQYGYGFDLAGTGWSAKDYELAMPAIKEFYKSKGLDARFEAISGFTDPSKDMRNAHIDVKPIERMRPEGAIKNREEYAEEQAKKGELLPLDEDSSAKERRGYFLETAKKTIEVRQKELDDYTKEAKKDNKIDEEEKKIIEEKKQALDVAKEDQRAVRKMKEADFTGNDILSSVLKDALNMMHCQPKQQ